MVYLTRREHFNAAHKLFNPKWTQEENEKIFGKCANHNWHGHNFDLLVTVKGIPNPDTGFVINAKILSEIIQKEVCEKLDHKNLNLDVDFMQGKLTSVENLVIEIWKILAQKITNCQLHSIKIYETENIYVEYFGE